MERVLPVERHGLHLSIEGVAYGLRLDTGLGRGVVTACSRGPARIKGGSSAWPDVAAVLDREWSGRVIESLAVDPSLPALRLQLGPVDRLWFCWLRRGGTLLAECAGEPFRSLPADRLEEVLSALASARPTAGDSEPSGSRELLEASDQAYQQAVLQAALETRQRGLKRIISGEAKRARRALAAIAREEASAEDSQVIRRRADALMAAGPAVRTDEKGGFIVPDPWEGGEIRVPAVPPGASVHECANRLYARARKSERGVVKRRERSQQLDTRQAQLGKLAESLAQAADEAALESIERQLEALGIAARPEHLKVSGAARKSAVGGEKSARVLRSPGGFTVLVGRSARQNDRLTFKVAGPEDYWLHVSGQSGSHVILRVEKGKPVPEEDLLFAAGLAAAWSGSPEGERVDVHVCRRKHVRKPRGAPPGAVLVRKSKTLQVVVPARSRR